MKYIGIVERAKDDKNGNKIAVVKPLYEISDSKWSVVDTREFRPDGKVFWFKAAAKLNDLIFFTVKENFNEDKYRFNLERPEPVIEIIDFRNLGAVEEVRKALASGLRYSAHLPDKCYILCKGGKIVGPLKLFKDSEDLLRYDAAQIHEIPCYSTDDTPTQEIRLDSETRLVCQDQKPLNICSYVDWDSNRNVIKRAVEYAVKNSSKVSGIAVNIKELVAETYERVKDGDDSAKLSLQINRLKRTAEIIKQVEISEEWASELVNDLMTLPSVKRELNSIRGKTRNDVLISTKKELDTELKEIEKAKLEKKKLESEIEESLKLLSEVEKELETRTQDIDQEIEKRIETIVNKPAGFIAEVAFLKAVLPHLSIGKAPKPNNANHTKFNIEWRVSDEKISTADELKKRIIKAFRTISVEKDVGIGIHAALTAGIMPILSGFNAGAAIDVYAKIACGGRLFRVPISPTSIDFGDLFGKFDENQGAFVGRGSNLLEILETAKRNTEPAVVVFEGINKAPTESYLIPLMEAIFFKKSLPVHSNNGAAQNFEWSENLFPTATIVEGPTTLPLSTGIWSRSMLLDAANEYSDNLYDSLSEIDSSSGLFDLVMDTDFHIDDIFEEFSEFGRSKSLANRFKNGLGRFYDSSNEGDQARMGKFLVESVILPLVAMMDSDEEIDEAVKKLTRLNIDEFRDAQTVKTLIRRIAKKIA